MKTPALLLALSLVILATTACQTIGVNSLEPIPIPASMTASNAKAALLLAAEKNFATPAWTNWEKIADAGLAAIAHRYDSQFKATSEWFIEDEEPDAVVYGLKIDEDYVRIRMTITGKKIVPMVDGSKNLRRKGDQIDEDVGEWYDDLEIMIRKAMGRISMLTASGSPPSK